MDAMDTRGAEPAFDPAELVLPDRVHRRIYTDPAIFDVEMRRIFGTTWVYAGHGSEVAAAGEYKLARIGKQPVIVARDNDGQLHVMFNRCRHRAATVCQEERGCASYFRCAYHGWTYNINGELTMVTLRQGYGDNFDQREWGLVHVPRVASYRGFIFASLRPDGASLDEYLGNAREYLDLFADASPEGQIVARSGVHKTVYQGNWKLQLENSVDCYHPAYVHASFFQRRQEHNDARGMGGATTGFPHSVVKALDNGHAVLDRRGDFEGRANETRYRSLTATPAGARFLAEMEARFGAERARALLIGVNGADFNLAVYPNLVEARS